MIKEFDIIEIWVEKGVDLGPRIIDSILRAPRLHFNPWLKRDESGDQFILLLSAQNHHPYLRPSPGGSLMTNMWVSIIHATPPPFYVTTSVKQQYLWILHALGLVHMLTYP